MPKQREKISEHPTSIILPLDMRARLQREQARRGNMPLAVLIKMIIAEWFALIDRRARKKKVVEQPSVEQ